MRLHLDKDKIILIPSIEDWKKLFLDFFETIIQNLLGIKLIYIRELGPTTNNNVLKIFEDANDRLI